MMNDGKDSNKISEFQGEYRFLSNFYPSSIVYGGAVWPTVEHAYQAYKTLNLTKRDEIRNASTPGKAKRLGRTVKLRPDWEQKKTALMLVLLHEKFKYDTLLGKRLAATGERLLIEGNNWNDTFWGVCGGRGMNVLGSLLMLVRAENALQTLAWEDKKDKENKAKRADHKLENRTKPGGKRL